MSNQRFIKSLLKYTVLGAGVAAYVYMQNFKVKRTAYFVESPVYREQLNGYTIAQISDLQYPQQRVALADIIDQVNAIMPNLIVLNGSNIAKSAEGFDEKEWFAFGQALSQMAPTFAVTGENETMNPLSRHAERIMHEAGVIYLNDQAITISYREEPITLIGLMEKPSRRFLAGDALRYIPLTEEQKQQTKILLAHHPEAFLRYHEDIQKSPDLVLAGYAHGGNIRIPGFGGVMSKAQGLWPKYTEGIFHIPGNPLKKMVVSRGIGPGEFAVRLNNQPEVVAVHLTDSKERLVDGLDHLIDEQTELAGGWTVRQLQEAREERRQARAIGNQMEN